jgi:hypothetical protein
MTLSITDPRTATDAVISALASTGKQIGDGVAPGAAVFPYAVVTPLADVGYDGPINDGQADVEMTWQVTSVGQNREQAQWMQDACRDALINGTLAITGRSVMKVDLSGGSGVERDDDFQPPLFYAVDVFEIMLTPDSTLGAFSSGFSGGFG